MAQVSNQTELQQALALSDPLIEVIADFFIASQITITYSVVIQSLGGSVRTLTRQAGFAGRLFYVSAGGNLTLRNLIIDGNKTATIASQSVIGTISWLTLDNTVIQNGSSTSNGGGIFLEASAAAVCVLQNSSIVQNCQTQDVGGGIFMNTGSQLTSSDSIVTGNTSNFGGGVFINVNAKATFVNGSVSNNSSIEDGGGIFINGGAQLLAERLVISENVASSGGGGIYINSNSTAELTTCKVADNQGNFGGGIFINSDGRLECEGSEISGNIATAEGGGIFFNSADATIEDTLISDNQANNGGGMYLNPNSQVTFTDGQINQNTATENGGGVFLNSAPLTFEKASIFGNSATYGAGIFANGDSPFTYDDGNISGNLATQGGGGVYINGGNGARITDGWITQNVASSGAGIYINGGSITVDTSNLTANRASENGGAVLISEGSAAFTGDSISDNNAANGAGLAVQNGGNLTYIDGRINGNVSSASGGGLYLIEGSLALIQGTSIYDNHATSGAGIAVLKAGILTYQNGEISRNAASGDGGAIYLAENGEAHIFGSTAVYANTAQGVADGIYDGGVLGLGGPVNIPNGVYLVSKENLIQVEAPLSGANIQLDQSSYVFPDQELAPIEVAEGTTGYPVLTSEDEAAFVKPTSGFDRWYFEMNEDNTKIQLNVLPGFEINYENLMGADNPNPDIYDTNTLPIVLQTLSPIPGLCFVGWFDSLIGGKQIKVIPEGTTGDITLYARWRAIRPVCCCKPCHYHRSTGIWKNKS